MKKKCGIIILGTGPETDFVIRNIHFTEIPLVGYGPYLEGSPKNDLLKYCVEKGISLVEDHFSAVELEPKFIFMFSYAPLIPQDLINRCDFINVHGALLPRFRGMHGGTWALINGEKRAGYTMHKVDAGIDSGPIYFQNSFRVDVNDDINKVRTNIQSEFTRNILAQLEDIYNNKVVPTPQVESQAIYVCKRYPEDSRIDWNWNTKRIHDFIRALAPPYTEGAHTVFKGEQIRALMSIYQKLPNYHSTPGQIVNIYSDKSVLVKTGDSVLRIKFDLDHIQRSDLSFTKRVGARFG